MYKKNSDRRDQMRRQYNPPPTYGGSRFIRATHGVRGLEDNEFALEGESWRPQSPRSANRAPYRDGGRKMPNGGELLPDFEYYTNMPDGGAADSADTQSRNGHTARFAESAQSREKRHMADEEYRDSPAPVDRIGHDYDMSPSDFWQTPDGDGRRAADGFPGDWHEGGAVHWSGSFIEGPQAFDGGEAADGTYTGDIADTDGIGCGDTDGAPDGGGRGPEDGKRPERPRRPMRRRGMFRADRPFGENRRKHASAPSDDGCAACPDQDEEQKPHPFANLSIEDGDLLLLVILALLAGEDGCADLVATLALLLMVR